MHERLWAQRKRTAIDGSWERGAGRAPEPQLKETLANPAPGRALDPSARRALEADLGHHFENVRVHADGEADRLARTVDAVAFAFGSDLYFRDGAYDPDSAEGRRLLAHELTHTLQQSRGPVAGTPGPQGILVSDPGDPFEQAADRAAAGAGAERAWSGPALAGLAPATAPVIQRAAPEAPQETDPGSVDPDPRGGLLDRWLGLNPDKSFIQSGLDALYGPDSPAQSQPGDSDLTTLGRAGYAAVASPLALGAVVGGELLDGINHPLDLLTDHLSQKDEEQELQQNTFIKGNDLPSGGPTIG